MRSPEIEKHLKLIFGYLRMLEDANLDENKKWLINAIEGELKQLFSLDKSYEDLDLNLEEQPFHLQPIVKEVIHSLSSEIRKRGIIVDYKPLEEARKVIGIPAAVRQAIRNVLEEELKRMKEGGIITLSEAGDGDRLSLKIRSEENEIFSVDLPLLLEDDEDILRELAKELEFPSLRGRGFLLFYLEGKEITEDLIRSFQKMLQKGLRKGDRVITEKDGHFLVVLRNVDDLSQAKSVLHRLCKLLDRGFAEEVKVRSSCGFVGPTDLTDAKSLLSNLREKLS